MAQLRDAQTSEVIAEGTLLEIAIAAEGLDPADVLFDDVGAVDAKGKSRFDPAAVREYRAAELAGFEAALADMPASAPVGVDAADYAARRAALRDAIRERKARVAAGRAMTADARSRMQAARDRVRR